MKRHRLYFIIFLSLILIVACQPSVAKIQEALEETKSAMPSLTQTKTDKPTSTEQASSTQTQKPTSTTSRNEMDGAELVYVPKGEFLMGSEDSDAWEDEAPEHMVYLDSYRIYKHEVTNSQFAEFVKETNYETYAEENGWSRVNQGENWFVPGAYWAVPQGQDSNVNGLGNYPVIHVSWSDADAYCHWAGGRLPTEAEWEKAARGTDGITYPWKNDGVTGEKANYCDKNCASDKADVAHDDGFSYSAPVGSYPNGACPSGALDMAGNVFEWVADWYDKEYYSQATYAINPQGPSFGSEKSYRGGSWVSDKESLRTFSRFAIDPIFTDDKIGFRCVLDEKDVTISITATSTITPSPTIFTPETDAEGNPVCVLIDPNIAIGSQIFANIEFQYDILNYLNAGGDPLELPQQLASDAAAQEPYLIAVYQPDFNSDQIPDVIVTVTLPYGNGLGESHVYAFLCQYGHYESYLLFRHAGAGIKAEGLYAGGGARIERLDDLNKSGNIEILFSVNYPWYAEYFIGTWDGGGFKSLISYPDFDNFGSWHVSFLVDPGNFKVEDTDGDGVYELIVLGNRYDSELEDKIYYWNGKHWLPEN